MGAINSRSGSLYFDFRYKGIRCREYTKLKDTPANRKRAKEILSHIEAEITLGSFNYAHYFPNSNRAKKFSDLKQQHNSNLGTAKLPTLNEFTDIWLAEKQVEWRKSYIQPMLNSLSAYVLPAFGDKEISSITKAEILSFRATLAKEPLKKQSPLLPASINKVMSPLRMMLNEAADRYDFNSPWKGIKTLKVPRTDVDPFSLEEVQLIINTVRKDFKNYFTVRFFTGMRIGEADGLRWKWVDFERRQILVRESWVANEMTTTKTDGSQRDIYMSEPVYQALLDQKKHTGHQDLVFCTKDGLPLRSNNIRTRVWYPILDYLGLKRRRAYQTRHTAATLWLAAGENPEWIARQMGHTTTEMLFRVYSRYVPNLTRQDGSAFDRLLTQELNLTATANHEEPLPTQQKEKK